MLREGSWMGTGMVRKTKMKIGIVWASRLKRKKMLVLSLVESEEIVVEAIR